MNSQISEERWLMPKNNKQLVLYRAELDPHRARLLTCLQVSTISLPFLSQIPTSGILGIYYTINYPTNDKCSEEHRNSWDTSLAFQELKKLKSNVERLYYKKVIFMIFISYNVFISYIVTYNMCMGQLPFEDPQNSFHCKKLSSNILTLKMVPHRISIINHEWKYTFCSLKFDWLHLFIAILDI